MAVVVSYTVNVVVGDGLVVNVRYVGDVDVVYRSVVIKPAATPFSTVIAIAGDNQSRS